FLKDALNVRQNPLLNLAVRHQINRFEPVVFVKGARDLRQVLASKRFTAGNDQDAKVCSQCLADTLNFPCVPLKFLARLIVEFVREKTMDASHIANRGHQDVQQNGSKWAAGCHPGISLENFFMMKIHSRAVSITLTQFWLLALALGA